MYRAQVTRIHVIHILTLILIILQIWCGYTVSVRSNHKLIVGVGIVNVVQTQRLPVMLLRIPISPVIISVVVLPPKIMNATCTSKVSRIYTIHVNLLISLNIFYRELYGSTYFGVGRGLPSLLRHCCAFSFWFGVKQSCCNTLSKMPMYVHKITSSTLSKASLLHTKRRNRTI